MKITMFKLLKISFLFLLFSTTLFSSPLKYNLKTDTNIETIAKDNTWHKLLYYKNGTSEVVTKDYFLSTTPINPKDELIETINSYEKYDLDNFDNSPVCKFPARYYWLSKQIDFPNYEMIDKRCKKLKNWSVIQDTKSISVMLVSGYLGNPASTFGHSFLKLNSSKSNSKNNLFDSAINYGALVPDNEAIISYIFNGITGGYEAGFSDKYFYTQDLVYTHTEFRDIWDYELNLSEAKKDLLLLHLWEIVGKKFQYFFIDKNCGYRVSQLVELALEKPILANSNRWYAPIETFHVLEEIDKKEKILNSITYIPSSQKIIFQQFKDLSKEEQNRVKFILNDNLKNINEIKHIDNIDILDFLINYHNYLLIQEPTNQTIKTNKQQLLLKRLSLPVKKEKHTPIKELISPAKGNKPIITSFGVTHSPNKKIYPTFNFTVFATESIGQNSLKNDELIVSDISLGQHNQKIFLDKFDLIKIKKLKTSQIDLEDENLLSWKVNIGSKRVEKKDEDKYNSFLNGSIGKSYQLNDFMTSSIMLDSNLQTIYPHIEAIPNIEFDIDLGKLKNSSTLGLKINPFNSQTSPFIKIDTQYNINNQFAIFGSIEKDFNTKYSLNIKRFF